MRVSCFLLACACGAVRLPPLASCATAMRYRPPLAFARARPVTLLADPGMLLGEVPMALASAADAAVQAADAMSEQGVLDSLGQDLFVFLVSSVVVVPLSRALGITPVLGFLALGCAIGPYGLGLFSDSEADLELGDFGILFLLFVEGLNLSPDRLEKLGSFFKLGVAQLLFSIGAFFFATLLIGPQLLPQVERFIPLDDAILRPILSSPALAFCIAAAGALSSSAFVLPILKQKGWEERADGTAALAVLLLQDLAVAPLLVVLPLVAGSGPSSPSELGVVVAKATFGFGGVLAAGSLLLREFFAFVAASRSSETFVAAALLVAVGMGQAAQELGLSASTGAFAAGVLLAGSQYRAQIEADIKPFEGILLGIFFMDAGAGLDPGLCVQEWPTLVTGIAAFLTVKTAVLFAANPNPNPSPSPSPSPSTNSTPTPNPNPNPSQVLLSGTAVYNGSITLPGFDAQRLLTKDSLKYKSSPALARSPLLASATVASSPTGAKQRSPYARPSSQLPLRGPMERGTADLGEDLLMRHRGGK